MIEKFTPEEIAILRKEIMEIDKQAKKCTLLKDNEERVRNAVDRIYSEWDPRDGRPIWHSNVCGYIYMLADSLTGNYVKKRRKFREEKSYYKIWQRTDNVPQELVPRYEQVLTKLTDAYVEISEMFGPLEKRSGDDIE